MQVLTRWGFLLGAAVTAFVMSVASCAYPRANFKRNRAAALAEWRQLGALQGASTISV